MKKRTALIGVAAIIAICLVAATALIIIGKNNRNEDITEMDMNGKWISTWGTAMLTAGQEQTPFNPGLVGNTVRQQIRVSVGGDKIRLVLSNEYGGTPLEVKRITIARLPDPSSSEIDVSSLAELSVDGSGSFSVPAGERVTTDELEFDVGPLEDLAITMELGSVPSTLTCHTASRCSTWIAKDTAADAAEFVNYGEMTSWYFITALDVVAGSSDSGVIVCFGDSLTDGASVTTNGFARYTDQLSRRLREDDALKNLAVVNMGIGATALYRYGGDIAGTVRANRDILGVPGVKYVVLFMGVNDIGGADTDISSDIISHYKSIIERCHENGIKIYGATITPFKGNGYYSELHEQIRLAVNGFVLSEDSGFDGCVDLASLMCDPSDPEKLEDSYVSVWNDYLHFNDSGYSRVGDAVYEMLASELS